MRTERSRTAPRAHRSSDVTRFRGVLAAAIVAGISVIAIAGLALGASNLRSPGPLSTPHAELECASCHEDRESACARCHGEHPSVRAGHLAQRDLACGTCHRAHGARALTFFPDGTVVDAQGEREVTSFRPAKAMHVPLIDGARCAACHDASAADDPIAVCLSAHDEVLCLDEHRRAGDARGLARDAAWEAAREIAGRPRSTERPSIAAESTWLWVLGAALMGMLALVVVRRARREPASSRRVVLPVIADKVRLPKIDASTCLGCYACVDACPYDVIAMEKFVAVVVKPKDCCGLTLCEQVCPNGSLVVTDGDPIEDRPRVSDALEAIDSPGIYLAGDLTGAPLIRNAIHQGALAVRAIAESVPRGSDLDLVIVGAGPAGISAALEAKARGLRYEVLEQGSVAESIRSFPRGKLVFDQPIAMPIAGELWLAESTKEELLAKWMRIVRKEQLRIREGHRVTAIERGEIFTVRATEASGAEATLRAKRVLLAVGRRGTPRKLEAEIPDDALDRVHYSLADARSHAGARAIVVGLGDVAMEAAIALAKQPKTRVTLVHRGSSFARGKARNVAEVERLVRDGRIELSLDTTIAAVTRGEVMLRKNERERSLAFDALFVMIGSLPPWPFLEAAGVRRARTPG